MGKLFGCGVALFGLLLAMEGFAFGAITTDVTVSQDNGTASATVTSPVFTTVTGNEELLALISTDYLSGANTTVKSVTGGGLTWTLIKRTNAQKGSAEIWGALAASPLSGVSVTATLSQSVLASMTVMSFSGVNAAGGIGATGGSSGATGAPTASLVTTGAGSVVVGVGNDYTNATARTLGAGQTLIHQDLTSAGDTYWVQMLTSPVTAAGTTATVNDTAPTKDSFNLSIVEVLAAVSSGPTYSITGTIAPTVGGSGATVTLSGAAEGTTVADANGNFAFNGLSNGSYTVTPSESGYTFMPGNQAVAVNGASQSGVNFTASPIPTWSISGTISPVLGGSGATVSLTGTSSGNTVTDGNGNYSFLGLANGSYTVTPSASGYGFSPSNQAVTIASANVAGVNFSAAALPNSIAVDVDTSQDGSKASATITSPAFSTAAGNELLLAFVATDYVKGANTTVTGVSGGGLTWTLVERTNAQSGSSEIWRAFSASTVSGATVSATLSQSVIASITVMSFTGVNTSGTNGSGAIGAVAGNSAASGAPTSSLVTLGSNSWVLGVGNDFDSATARTLGSGQTLVHQYLTPKGDTYWVQRETAAVPASGTTVTINDTAPTKDRWNLSIVEVVAEGSSTATPPSVSMTAPNSGALVSGTVTVSANASDAVAVAGVQFLLDGVALGAEVTSSPYTIAWDTTTAATGPHLLAARAMDSEGLATISASVPVTVGNSATAPGSGYWSTPVTTPAVAVNLILLQNNRVLFYQDGVTPTVWDYVAGTFANVPAPADIFCSGHALMSDGRILVVGGYGGSSKTIGIKNAEIFDPVALTWTPVPHMQYRRWYPNATTLPTGQILVVAGWQTTSNSNAGISEIYDPVANSWTSLTNANNPFETYPFLYVLPDGRVIHIGGSEYATDTDVLDLTTTSWSVIDSRIIDGGSATMYLPGKFMKAGSAADSQNVGPSSNTTFVLDMTQPTPAWQQTASMANARSFMNLTMLPDGTVLATGGETDKNGGNIANAVYAAELWSPVTQTWSTMASMATPREYHGTALLLPDGRVLESGMGADFGNVPNELSAEFYSPPYLFKGARPTVTQAPTQISYGTNFFVGTPDGASIASVSLIRTGAVTHFFDQNERFLPLSFAQTTGGLTVTAPANTNLAPPGYYMLFLVNSAGVPSIAPFVQIP